ncbi:MAG: ABC-2 family transporter protein, partial [Propionibacteriales bacterium]|nr:ABC-2 family transporter protein [Propionibacteriales bacterium]
MADHLLSPYRAVVSAQLRSQLSYRSSFWTNLAASFALGLLEFVEIYVLLTVSPVLGGLTFAQATLVFALANLGFALADLVCGQIDSMPTFIRQGQLDGYLLRPLPLLPQMMTATFELRRLGRAAFGVLALIMACVWLDLDWSVSTIYLMIITPLIGALIHGALFVLAGGLQFWLVDGAEFTNGFVYGSSYAGQVPGSVLLAPAKIFFTFVIPAT